MKSATMILIFLGVVFVYADVEYTVFSDAVCTTQPVSYFWTYAPCQSKRSALGGSCTQIPEAPTFYYRYACTAGATVAPDGWSVMTLFPGSSSACESTLYDFNYYAALQIVKDLGVITPMVVDNAGSVFFTQINVECSAGVMNVTRCASGCSTELLPNGECVTFEGYVGDQSTCQAAPAAPAAPVAPMAPMAAPTAAPTSTPKAATPANKSSASVVALSGFVLLAGLFAL